MKPDHETKAEMQGFNDLLKQLLKTPPQKKSDKSDHQNKDIDEEAS